MKCKLLIITLILLSCEKKTPSENKLLDYNEPKLIVNMLNVPYDVVYNNTNFSNELDIEEDNNTMRIEMRNNNVPVVTVHDFYFEMENFVELPNFRELYLDMKYTINVTNPVHSNYDILIRELYYKHPDDLAWNAININDINSLLETPFPVRFRFYMRALSGIAGIRGQEVNTATLNITRFGVFGEF